MVYKYFVLFPFIVIEGPIVTIIAGFLSSLDLLNIFIVYPVVVAADLTGDLIYYSFGRWGKENFINSYGKYFGLKEENVKKIENHFEKHTRKTLIIGKLSHAFGAPILFAAGMVKVPLLEYLWFNFLATLPKSLAFLLIGYYFGQFYVRLNKYLNYFSIGLLVFVILVLIAYYGYNKVRRRFNGFLNRLVRRNILKV